MFRRHRPLFVSKLAALCLFVAVALCVTSLAAEPQEKPAPRISPEASAKLKKILGVKLLRKASVGISFQTLDGTTLFSRKPTLSLNPASVAKMFTTSAALHYFTPAHRFRTIVSTDRLQNGVARNLFIRGGGDPSLLERDLWQLVLELKRRGLKRVQGTLTIDLSRFDGQHLPPVYKQKPVDAWYRPSIGAFSAEHGMVTIRIKSGAKEGDPLSVVLAPNCAYLKLEMKASTAPRKSRERLKVNSRGHGWQTVIAINGKLRAGRTVVLRKRVYHPARYAASLLALQFKRHNIPLKGGIRFGPTPPNAERLFTHLSPPMSSLVRTTNKRSSNFMAEMLLKNLAVKTGTEPGSFAAGIAAIKKFLVEVVKLGGSYRLKNGSGLYDANRFSALQVVQLLRHMSGRPRLYPEFRASLPIGGMDGTLSRRLRKSSASYRVWAKTGTLDGVSGIAGYLLTRSGKQLVFAILINGPVVAYYKYRVVQDKILKVLATQ